MKKAAVLLMLIILLCAWMCLSAGASEKPGRKRLIVASVIGDEGEKCYYYRAPEESQKQIAGFYYPGAQVYMLEYGPEWCRVFLCAEGYMKTSQLKRTGAAKIEPIGFAFASFELGEPFVDPNGFIESLGDCDLSKHGDIVENGGALKLIGYAGEFLQIQYGNYDGFILSRYASTMPFDSILLPDEAQRTLAAGSYTIGENLPAGLWRISAQQGQDAIVKIQNVSGKLLEHRISGRQNAPYAVLLPMQANISLSEPCIFTPVSSINMVDTTVFNGRQICGIDFRGAPEAYYKIVADNRHDAYYIVSTLMQDITLDVGERYMLQPNEEISERLNDGYVIELHNCSLIDTADETNYGS